MKTKTAKRKRKPGSLPRRVRRPKRVPLHERFWAVINFRGEVFPTAISYTRSKSIWRFINDDRAGYGDTWKKWKRAGFKCVRVTISPNDKLRDGATERRPSSLET